MKKVELCPGEEDVRLVLLREGLKVQGGWKDPVRVSYALLVVNIGFYNV